MRDHFVDKWGLCWSRMKDASRSKESRGDLSPRAEETSSIPAPRCRIGQCPHSCYKNNHGLSNRLLMRDLEIRHALDAMLRGEHATEPNTLIRHELGLCAGNRRVDVAVINGELAGWGIESDVVRPTAKCIDCGMSYPARAAPIHRDLAGTSTRVARHLLPIAIRRTASALSVERRSQPDIGRITTLGAPTRGESARANNGAMIQVWPSVCTSRIHCSTSLHTPSSSRGHSTGP